jgi:hypothetical protein
LYMLHRVDSSLPIICLTAHFTEQGTATTITPAAAAQTPVVGIFPICDWVDPPSTPAPAPAPAPQLPEGGRHGHQLAARCAGLPHALPSRQSPMLLVAGAVALPVLTSSLYDSYPENVGTRPTPVLCPAGEYVVGITAWTTFVFSSM